MKAEIIEKGHCLADHAIYRHPETGDLRVQGKPVINWVWEVARDCTAIDEVRLICGKAVAVFAIDRDYDPPRVAITQVFDGRNVA